MKHRVKYVREWPDGRRREFTFPVPAFVITIISRRKS